MTTTNQKQEILQSLSSLDSVQSEKVLNYIKGLKGNQNEVQYQRLKQEAMKEISQALGQGRQLTF
jgi:hypothetical protein